MWERRTLLAIASAIAHMVLPRFCHRLFTHSRSNGSHTEKEREMRPTLATGCLVVSLAQFNAVGVLAQQNAGPVADAPSLVGAWTLNKDLSDQPNDRRPDGQDRPRGGRGGGGFGGRGGRGGGFGGGFGGGRGGSAFGGNPEEMRRRMDALRDMMQAPDHLTIAQTDSLVIVTGGDGRTTRLAPNGKKIKDESNGAERKTKWDGGKLVTEITNVGPGKITETYVVDVEKHHLEVTLQTDSSRAPNGGMVHRVYDLDPR